MSAPPTPQLDLQKIIEWLRQNWIIVLIAIIVLVLVLRLVRGGRRRVIIE
jgi:capsular polysaccharide biosynthesis protein